jgi:hypothetical protein
MQLKSLTINGQESNYALNFHAIKGSGAQANVAWYHGTRPQIERIEKALSFLFSGGPISGISGVSLSCADSAGLPWRIKRNNYEMSVERDGVPLGSGGEAEFFRQVFDAEEETDSTFAQYDLSFSKDRLQFNARGQSAQGAPDHECWLIDVAETLKKQLCVKLGISPKTTTSQLVSTFNSLKSIREEYNALHSLALELAKSIPSKTNIKGDQAAEQLKQIEKIESELSPLLKASDSPQQLRARLLGVHEKLAEIQESFSCPEPWLEGKHPQTMRDYRQALEALARVEVYEKLVKASHKSLTLWEKGIYKKEHDTFQGVLSYVSSFKEQISDYKNLLSSLQVDRSDLNKDGTGKGVSKIFGRILRWRRDQTDKEASANVDPHFDFERSEMLLGELSQYLEQMLQDNSQQKSRVQSDMEALKNRHDALISHYSAARKQWRKVARSLNLNEDYTLKALFAFIGQAGKVVILAQERSVLKTKILKRQEALVNLRELVSEWRLLTNSTRCDNLNEPALLISEARDIVQQKSAKQGIWLATECHLGMNKLKDATRRDVEVRQKSQLMAWRDALEALDLNMEIDSSDFSNMLGKIDAIKGLALAKSMAKEVEIRADRTFSNLFNVFSAANLPITPAQAREVSAQLVNLVSSGIVLTSSEVLGDELSLTHFTQLVREQSQKPISPEKNTPTYSPQVSDNRAQRALAILRGQKMD